MLVLAQADDISTIIIVVLFVTVGIVSAIVKAVKEAKDAQERGTPPARRRMASTSGQSGRRPEARASGRAAPRRVRVRPTAPVSRVIQRRMHEAAGPAAPPPKEEPVVLQPLPPAAPARSWFDRLPEHPLKRAIVLREVLGPPASRRRAGRSQPPLHRT
jgi:hypothetical protein